MRKADAIELLSATGLQKETAKALGISQQAVSIWPDPLSLDTSLKVLGAAMVHQLQIPEPLILQAARQIEDSAKRVEKRAKRNLAKYKRRK
jgi:hypothetical protein